MANLNDAGGNKNFGKGQSGNVKSYSGVPVGGSAPSSMDTDINASNVAGTSNSKSGVNKKSMKHKLGDAIEKVGDVIEHSVSRKLGDKIEKCGDKIEHADDAKH